MSGDLLAVNPCSTKQVILSPIPTLKNLTEASVESYMNALNITGQDVQHSAPVSRELMAERLVKFLNNHKGQINREQVKLISRAAKNAQLIGNSDKSRDFETLVKCINDLKAKLPLKVCLKPRCSLCVAASVIEVAIGGLILAYPLASVITICQQVSAEAFSLISPNFKEIPTLVISPTQVQMGIFCMGVACTAVDYIKGEHIRQSILRHR